MSLISCDIDIGFEEMAGDPYEVKFYGKILEKETLAPLDSVKIEISSVGKGLEHLFDHYTLNFTIYSDSLGNFDYDFTAYDDYFYKFEIYKEKYEVSSISPSLNEFPESGNNEYYIEMGKIFPRELKLEIRKRWRVFNYLTCVDSSSPDGYSVVVEQLPEMFAPANNPFWPFQQLTFLSKDTFMLKDNSANLIGPYFANYQGNGFSFDTDSSIFKLRGDWQSTWDYGYHYTLARNNEGNSFVEEKSGRGLLKQTTLDSLRKSLNENDTLRYEKYIFKYEKFKE